MRAAWREYWKLLLPRWWCLGPGAAAGIVGLLADMDKIGMPLPPWIWWGLALVALAIAQFWAFRAIHKEVEQYRKKTKPDSSLYVVFDYVYKRIIKDPNVSDPINATTNRIIERAITGELQMFGTRTNPDEGDGIIEPIDREYWRDHKFFVNEMHYFKLSPNEKMKRMKSTGEGDIFYNLQVDSTQVFLCWPQDTRIRLQWPLRREAT